MVEKFGRGDLLPFWIADMDFEAPPCILDALRSRLDQRVLGYTTVPEDFWQSIASGSADATAGMWIPARLLFFPV